MNPAMNEFSLQTGFSLEAERHPSARTQLSGFGALMQRCHLTAFRLTTDTARGAMGCAIQVCPSTPCDVRTWVNPLTTHPLPGCFLILKGCTTILSVLLIDE